MDSLHTLAPPRRETPRRGARDRQREAALFRRYCSTRDPSVREELVAGYLPLARSIARRYQTPRVALEDLVQVAALGLMKAIDRYEPSRGSAFTSYAVPTMVGEVQRYFRDQTWSVRPPRDLQERALRLRKAGAGIGAELGRAPTPAELARATDLSVEQVVEALEAAEARDGTSLDRPRTQGEPGDTVADAIGHLDQGFDRVDAAITADLLMAELTERERKVVRLRFHEDLTQLEIGEIVGCSQMHVSRILRGAMAKLSAAAQR